MCWPASGRGQGWSQGRVWPAGGWAASADYKTMVFLLAGVCLLGGRAGPKARAASLVSGTGALRILGFMSANWWVLLGPGTSGERNLWVLGLCLHTVTSGWVPGPFVGKAVSRGGCWHMGS